MAGGQNGTHRRESLFGAAAQMAGYQFRAEVLERFQPILRIF
jgi:hypothetical protein